MKEKSRLIKWIRKHKKALTVAGISITALIAVVLGLKHADEVKELLNTLRKTTEHSAVTVARETGLPAAAKAVSPVAEEAAAAVSQQAASLPYEVSKHLRNLPEGWNPSPEKVASALENGFELAEGQTWVDTFTKGAA